MEIIITSLIESAVDKFICGDIERYITVRPSEDEYDTVDLYIRIKTFAVDSNRIIIEFPDSTVLAINIPSVNYHKIEVM